ncbi:MAG: glycosyltransferase family 4 protein [Aliidongia sp.]
MHIALIDPSLFTLPYDLKLAGGLAEVGHRVERFGTALPADQVPPPLLRPHFYGELAALGAERWPAGLGKAAKGLAHLRGMWRLAETLERERPDIIHFQWLPLPIVDRAFLARLRRIAPLVVTAHDSEPFNGNAGAALQHYGAIESLGRFDRIIIHTEQARRRLIGHRLAPAKLSKIAHGFLDHDEPAAPPASGAGKVRFLLFGKVKPYKGADLLIEAARRLAPAIRARCEVLIVGKPYMDTKSLTDAAAMLGGAVRCEFRFVPDTEMHAMFAAADVLVFPYREIDMSGVLMAALKTSRPMLASNIGGFAELLEHGRHGLLVPPGDIDGLAAAMTRLVCEPETRSAMADAIRALAGSIPTWRQIAETTTELYRKIRNEQSSQATYGE